MHRRFFRPHRRRREGMTLVEIMIVVIILALIATAVGIVVIPMFIEGQEHVAESEVATLRTGVQAYFLVGGAARASRISSTATSSTARRTGRIPGAPTT